MKSETEDFGPFNNVVDSMQAAAGRLGVPLEMVKAAKRAGSDAFRGSRVHLGKLAKALAYGNEPSLSEILMSVLEWVVTVIADKEIPQPDAFNLASTAQVGLGTCMLVLEPTQVDEFLRQSAKLCERIVGCPLRKAATRR
jgi:hypothetical protein